MEGLESMTPLEAEKKDLMARLGEIYYKKCKESGNVTAEEAEILEKIARLDQEMPGEDTEYQGSVCPGCGAPVEPDQVFCVNCGIRLVEDDAVTEMHLESDTPKPGNVCPHCGAPVNDDQDFCIMCGTRLGQPGQQAGGGPGPAGSCECSEAVSRLRKDPSAGDAFLHSLRNQGGLINSI